MLERIVAFIGVVIGIFYAGKISSKAKQTKTDLKNVRDIQKRQIERDSDSIDDVRNRLLKDARKE